MLKYYHNTLSFTMAFSHFHRLVKNAVVNFVQFAQHNTKPDHIFIWPGFQNYKVAGTLVKYAFLLLQFPDVSIVVCNCSVG